MVPDADYIWSVKTYDKAIEIIEKEKIDILYTTSFPYSDHLLGAKIKERFPSLPWVIDFRDEWTNNPYILDKNYKPKRANKEKQMETMVANKCDKFIANTTFMLDNFLVDYPNLKSKSFVITNGYDDSDFADTDPTYSYKDTFTITYGGAMYGRRNPDKLFNAIRQLIDQKLIDSSKFRMKFIGGMDFNKINGYLDTYNLKEIVTLSDYLPHKKILKELSLTDVLLLLIGEGKNAKSQASGKIFEYINSNRPILAIVPEVGAAADIIRESNTGVVCELSSVEAIMSGVLELYQRWENKSLIIETNKEAIKKYHRKELTKNLASIFDSL
jgi:glycosyltransferase involved in cell wall biosynthesis